MKRGRLFIIILFTLLALALVIIFFAGSSIFIVKNVEISKNFKIDKEKILQYLEIYPLRPIWKYNTAIMQEKMSKHFYLEEYKIYKKYPNTLAIEIKIRKPIAKIVGADGEIYVVDKEGIIFRRILKRDNIYPLIMLEEREKIKIGIKIKGVYRNIIDILSTCKKEAPDLYNAISQIEIAINKKYGVDCVINYRTFYQQIYLKNRIDVDGIRRGLSCILYMENSNQYYKKLLYTGKGFVVTN